MKRPNLSIIILNHNTVALTRNCLASIEKNRNEVPLEVIVSDNGSSDGSLEMTREEFPWVKVVENETNLGFADGKHLDKDARRGFPTPWVALTHFSGLDRLLPNSKLFAKYWYGGVPEDKVQEVDVIQGAYFLSPKKLLDKVGWFDEAYFLDGEDIDLCWKIHEAGKKIIYYPKASIIHLKGATKGKNKKTNVEVSLKNKIKFRMSSVNSMEIFYRKRMWKRYPILVNILVVLGIKCLKGLRLIKLLLS